MAKSVWFVHILGENFGPLSQELLLQMVQQNRVQLSDFVWAEHLTKWQRLMDLDEFAHLLPAYPQLPIPQPHAAAEPSRPPPAPNTAPTPTAKVLPLATPVMPATPPLAKGQRFPRITEVNGSVEIHGHGPFAIADLSEGGMYLGSEQPLVLGSEIRLILHMHSLAKSIELTGVVIRHGAAPDLPGFAVQFTRLNPAHRRLLQEFVKQRMVG